MHKRLLLNSLSGTALFLTNIVIMFIMSPVIVKSLGNQDYGIWEMMIGVVGYMGLLDLGIGPALLRHVSVAHARNDREELEETIASAQLFFLAVALVAVGALVGLSRYPNLLIGSEGVDAGYVGSVIIFFAVNACLAFPLTVLTAVLMGVQRHYLNNLTRGLMAIVRAAIAYHLLLTYAGQGLLVLAVLEPVFNLVQFSIFALVLRRDATIPPFRITAASLGKVKELFEYGIKSSTLMIASRIQSASLPFVISAVIGVSSIVYYSIPSRLVDYAKGFALALGFPLTPYLASQMSSQSRDSVKVRWLQTSLALQIITTSMPLFILFLGETFLSIWMGKEYAEAGRGVLHCLVTALFFEALAPNASHLLLAAGQHGKAALVWLGLSVLSIPLAIAGASAWGVTGVALGTSTALIVGTLSTLLMACNHVGITFVCYLRCTTIRLLVPLSFLACLLWTSSLILSAESYLNIVLRACSCGVLYLVAVWLMSFDIQRRTNISKIALNRLNTFLTSVTMRGFYI
jgi:O-antigen/teichoic acid export membrane protein